ncbi:MAG: TolC family protein [Ignavibacteriae bacterium]|nr:TolC family protein [Ignavibacteriota bacterium]
MKLISSFIILLLFIIEAFAQQTKTYTLNEAINLALERNLSVVQAQNNVESAQARVLAAYGNYLPALSAFGGWNRTQNDRAASSTQIIGGQALSFPASFSVTNNFSTRVDLSYVLFDGFAREANFNSASASALSTEQQAARTRQSIVYQVENAYLNVLRKEQLVKVSEENLKRGRRQLERITESNRVGALPLADVYRQQSQVAADELNLITAQNDYEKAKADLVALIGSDMAQEHNFSDPSISPETNQTELDSTKEMYSNFHELTQRSLANRPDYMATKESFRSAEAGVTAARSGYFPTISASAGYSLSNTELSTLRNNKNIAWGINIRWNLFDAFQTNQSLQSAIADQHNAEVAMRQAERDIGVEVKKALLDLEAARKGVEVSQKGLRSAMEDRKIAEERYNLGAGTLLDLLTANAGLVNAQANNINASYFYIIAKRNLEYVIGERTY